MGSKLQIAKMLTVPVLGAALCAGTIWILQLMSVISLASGSAY